MFHFILPDKKLLPIFSGLYQGDLIKLAEGNLFAVGALNEGKPAGLLLSTIYPDKISIDWIYVDPDFRGLELGKRLVTSFMNITIDMGFTSIIRTCCTDEGMKTFLEGCGVVFSEDIKYYSYKAALSEMTALPNLPSQLENIYSLQDLTTRDLKGINLFLASFKDGAIGVDLPIEKNDYLDVPSVYLYEDKLRALLLLQRESEKEVSISFVLTPYRDGKALLTLISETRKKLIELIGEDTIIYTASIGENGERLMDRLFPKAEKTPIYSGIYMQ